MPGPWIGDAMTLPSRVDGFTVLAAFKRPTGPTEPAHQWDVVIEIADGVYQIGRLSFEVTDRAGGGRYRFEPKETLAEYDETVRRAYLYWANMYQ